jgi:putative endonuclease
MEIFYIYALLSQIDKRIYVGFTKNLQNSINEHNAGKTKSTKGYRPWVLIYYEPAYSRDQARKREKYLKSGCGKEFLKLNLQEISLAL